MTIKGNGESDHHFLYSSPTRSMVFTIQPVKLFVDFECFYVLFKCHSVDYFLFKFVIQGDFTSFRNVYIHADLPSVN